MKRALSGIKATGIPHLGNILGMVLPSIELQNTHETFYFIANFHALSTVHNAKELVDSTYEVAAHFLALGLDPARSAFFRQSDVPEVTELSWLLSCAVSMGDLTRAHSYKAAKDKNEEGRLNFATFAYPVLMAADIMLYDADVVPVGKDQIQHLEMARAMAGRFNHYFGETLKEPKELVQESVAIVPGTDGRKMSKSYNNGIDPLRAAKEVKKQVMNIVSDSKGLEDPKDPSTCNIFALYKLFASAAELKVMEEKYRAGNYGYGHAKLALLEKVEEKFGPARLKYEELIKDRAYLDKILTEGADKARTSALTVLNRARKACGVAI